MKYTVICCVSIYKCMSMVNMRLLPARPACGLISLGYCPPCLQKYTFSLEYDPDNPVSLGIASETQAVSRWGITKPHRNLEITSAMRCTKNGVCVCKAEKGLNGNFRASFNGILSFGCEVHKIKSWQTVFSIYVDSLYVLSSFSPCRSKNISAMKRLDTWRPIWTSCL